MPHRARIPSLLLIGCLLLVAPDALGEPSAADRALAEVLFREARELMEQEKTEQACAKFEESYRLDPAIGTLLNLAVCHESQGRLASAWGEYNRAITIARQGGDQERMQFAQQGSQRLEGRLPTLRIHLDASSQNAPALELFIDSRKLGLASIDTPIPVDPGQHEVRVGAEGYQPWSSMVGVAPDSGETRVEVPALERVVAPPADEQQPAPAAAPAPVSSEVAADRAVDDGSGQRTLGIVLGAVGVAGVAVGGVFGVRAIQKKHERDDYCEDGKCSSKKGIDAHRDARSAATVSNVAVGAGLALLTGGVVLFLTAPNGETRAQIRIDEFAHGVGLTWEHSW